MQPRRPRTRPTPALAAPALLSLALLALATAADAQSNRAGLTLMGGGSIHGDMTPGLTPTIFEPGWIAGLQAESWFGGGRAGVRLNGLFTQRMLDDGRGDYNVYMADVDLLVRVLPVRAGRALAPYLALGAGASRYDAVASWPVFAGGVYGSDPVHRAHVLAGLGIDVLSTRGAGLRLEVADQIVLPSVGRSPESSGVPTVHNLVVTAGLQLRVGSLERRVVMARPEPAPRAEPAMRTQPAPRRAEADVLYTVQVEQFVEAATARRWYIRLQERAIPVWLLDTVIRGEPVNRVRVGALRSETEARNLAAALERDYGWRVRVDRVTADEPLPADALEATRAFLHGG